MSDKALVDRDKLEAVRKRLAANGYDDKACKKLTEILATAQPAEGREPQCPYYCGWQGLHSIITTRAAYFARASADIDPELREAAIELSQYALELCRWGMTTAPADTEQPSEAAKAAGKRVQAEYREALKDMAEQEQPDPFEELKRTGFVARKGGKVYRYEDVYKTREQPITPHHWDASGERCLRCGDKDWMGGGCKPITAQEGTAIAKLMKYGGGAHYSESDLDEIQHYIQQTSGKGE